MTPAPIDSYPALIAVIRTRIDELHISHDNVEEIAGLTVGHLGKTLGPAARKRFGLEALWLLLPALGLRLVVEQDMDAVRLMERRWEIRDELRRRAGVMRRKFTPEMHRKVMAEIGKVGASVRSAKHGNEKKSEWARKAALTRWRKTKKSDRAKQQKTLQEHRWKKPAKSSRTPLVKSGSSGAYSIPVKAVRRAPIASQSAPG